MTYRQYNIHVKAFELKQDIKDRDMWTLGIYIHSAVVTAVEHCLVGSKAKSEYIKRPLRESIAIDEERQREKTVNEEKQAAEHTFLKLQIMQANYNLAKQRKRLKQENKGDNT